MYSRKTGVLHSVKFVDLKHFFFLLKLIKNRKNDRDIGQIVGFFTNIHRIRIINRI